MEQYVERVVDLTDGALNQLVNMPVEEARSRVLSGDADAPLIGLTLDQLACALPSAPLQPALVRLAGARRENRATCPFIGSTDALLPREEKGRTGSDRRGPD